MTKHPSIAEGLNLKLRYAYRYRKGELLHMACYIPIEKGAKADLSFIISGFEYQRSGMNASALV